MDAVMDMAGVMMRRLALAILAMAIPAGTLAQEVYIRLEARRDAGAVMAAVERYAAEADDVVTYPAGVTWTAIGLGPISGGEAAARARLVDLKARGIAPDDAFVTTLEAGTPVSDLARLRAGPEAAPGTDDDTAPPQVAAAGASLASVVAAADGTGPADLPADLPTAAPEAHIRLEAFSDRAGAEAALARWRALLPGATLWQLPDGWFVIATGPLDAGAARGWLHDWQAAGAMPDDAFITDADRLGTVLIAGAAPDLIPPPAPLTMPPVATVQEALHWAGHYQGEIDGRAGPQTTAALAAAMAAQGIDPASHNAEARAVQALLARRAAWAEAMGLERLDDDFTGLGLIAPMARLEFLRTEHGLSIYGPKAESGAALILFNRPGGRDEMTDLAGFVTALGWVPHPRRDIGTDRFVLDGENDTHIGHAEGRIQDGRIQGFVLIWPQGDAENAPRLVAEAAATLGPATAPGGAATDTATTAD